MKVGNMEYALACLTCCQMFIRVIDSAFKCYKSIACFRLADFRHESYTVGFYKCTVHLRCVINSNWRHFT